MERSKKIIQISFIGIVVNLILVAFKAAVGAATGSIAVILDAVNNLSDALSSVITIIGTKLANKSPDKKHPYGYGKIEHITAITISIIVLVAGLTAFKGSFEKLLNPEQANYTGVSLIIIAVAVLVKFLLGRYVKRAGKQYNSESLIASGTESIYDAVISLSTLAAAGISMVWGISMEGWLGIVISVIIIKAGVESLMESLNDIIGVRVDREFSIRLKAFICQYPNVLGAYDLILHRYGPERIIGSVHVELPDAISAQEIHLLTRQIAQGVYREFGITLTVGIYASNTTNAEYAAMKDKLLELTEGHPDILQMHGFYVDAERMLVSFDLVIDFKTEHREALCDEMIQHMKALYPEYEFVVILDSDYSD